MKQFFKMFFASMFAIVISGIILILVTVGLIASAVKNSIDSKPTVTVADNSLLYIDLGNTYHEQGEENPFAILNKKNQYSAGLYDVLKAIEHAKTDDRIKGIYLKLSPSPNGWSTLQEIRDALVDFKSSDKFIYAYGEYITQSTYFVATAADEIYLNPVGNMELKGFATVLAFFKGTLDKLGVEPEIFYAGKFKSATEPFRTTQMSDANRQQILAFQKGFWSQFINAVADFSGKDTAAISALAANGTIEFPKDAADNKLVTGLMYDDQVRDLLRKALKVEEDKKIKFLSISNYAEKIKDRHATGDSRIAVVFAEGAIIDGEAENDYEVASADMLQTLRKIRKNDKIKAVVLRVNSPGGSALASEVILRELQIMQKEKPVIVSMGDMAASGGYYISCQADSIFVMPNTITGSIGVFSMMFNTQKLMENKLGITFDEVKNAPYADFPSGVRPLTADERQRMQVSVDNIYTIFKERVAKGRNMTVEAVDEIAQGRVWTGTDAVANGLADGFGGLDRAILSASRKAGLGDYEIVTYPDPADKFERIMKMFNGASVSADVAKVVVEKELGEEFKFIKRVKNLKRMNGHAMMMLSFDLSVQ